jgi:hypothetical protein
MKKQYKYVVHLERCIGAKVEYKNSIKKSLEDAQKKLKEWFLEEEQFGWCQDYIKDDFDEYTLNSSFASIICGDNSTTIVIDCLGEDKNKFDIYLKQYDYDEIKIAVVIAETFKDWKIVCDYEDIALLVITIREKWKEYQPLGYLTEEEFAYMQKWATSYLNENKEKIIKEFT